MSPPVSRSLQVASLAYLFVYLLGYLDLIPAPIYLPQTGEWVMRKPERGSVSMGWFGVLGCALLGALVAGVVSRWAQRVAPEEGAPVDAWTYRLASIGLLTFWAAAAWVVIHEWRRWTS